jgi:hypothetical protein
MKKDMPKTKAQFAVMLMRDYGHSEKLANDCAAIVDGYGAFNPILHDPDATEAMLLLIRKGYSAEDICKGLESLS